MHHFKKQPVFNVYILLLVYSLIFPGYGHSELEPSDQTRNSYINQGSPNQRRSHFLKLHHDLWLRENNNTLQIALRRAKKKELSLQDIRYVLRTSVDYPVNGESKIAPVGHLDLQALVISQLYACIKTPPNQWTDKDKSEIRALTKKAIEQDGITSWVMYLAKTQPIFSDFKMLKITDSKNSDMSAYLYLSLLREKFDRARSR